MTGATTLLIVGAAAAFSTRGFGLLTAAALPTPQPSAAPGVSPTARATPSPTVRATPRPSTKTATPTSRPASPTPRSTPHVYVAQAGDSLSRIAARFGVTTQALMAANGLANPNLVNVGQVLVIPD